MTYSFSRLVKYVRASLAIDLRRFLARLKSMRDDRPSIEPESSVSNAFDPRFLTLIIRR